MCIIHFTCTLYNRMFACTEPSLSLHTTVDDNCARLRYLKEEVKSRRYMHKINVRVCGIIINLLCINHGEVQETSNVRCSSGQTGVGKSSAH